MKILSPKKYQDALLASVEKYFRACREYGEAKKGFHNTMLDLWGEPGSYKPLPGFAEGMPYFCLRVPTGGGKTRLGARCVPLVNRFLLQTERSVILWLVPSNAIREQTLKAFQNREHPYYADLSEAGPFTVLDLDNAKGVTRSTLDTSTVIIVATRQAFSQQEMAKLKVYEDSGSLMPHFSGITQEQKENLLPGPEGTLLRSFANVLRLRRPFIVVDEAHNARTELQFETLARFSPSGILELTATPDMENTPSNVLHSISAAELKIEGMIKLPIILETEPDWQKVLARAIDQRHRLQALADREHMEGASYLRPLVLIQAQPRRQGMETLHAEKVKEELLANHNLPEEEIAIATGEQRDLEGVDLFSEKCRIKYIITQKALAEGWDCSFAYVLASLAELSNETAVEQLLGRILRQPDAELRKTPELNHSYAFVASRNFGTTAQTLRDRLVEGAGFEQADAWQFVAAGNQEQSRLDITPLHRVEIRPVVVHLTEKPNLAKLPKPLRDKLEWNAKESTLTIKKPVAPDEEPAFKQSVVWEQSQKALTEAAYKSRTEAVEIFKTPSELGVNFSVPQMAIRQQGSLELFEDADALDYPWDLPVYEAVPTTEEWSLLNEDNHVAETGSIDVEKGHVTVRFLPELDRDFAFSYTPEHWTEAKLAAWLCRNMPYPSMTHESKMVFVSAFVRELLRKEDMSLARANRQKFLLRTILEAKTRVLRGKAVEKAYQQFLFTDGAKERVIVGDGFEFVFHPDGYAPNEDYPRAREFGKHYYPRVGKFDSGEEEECAWELERLAQRGDIKFWVRNLVRKPTCSFSLPGAKQRFYPDFVCRLPDGRNFVVEYKGKDKWDAAKPDRDIGELWEELSKGRGLFVMVTNREWHKIAAKLKK